MTRIHIGSINDIQTDTMKTIMAGGKKIAVANVDGEYFAFDDTCSHQNCSLGGEGVLDGTIVICGCHGASFDVTNGKVLSLPAITDIQTYDVMIENDKIFVDL